MSRIEKKFKELFSKGEKALIAYVMAGYPSEKDSISAIRGLVKGGADIIEIGFPFSDPLADGPVIQNASMIALQRGEKLEKFFKMIQKIRRETDIPLVVMTYTNILYKKGYANFIKKAKKAGIDGFILPDMSIEESKDYLSVVQKNNLDTIFLISPNTEANRLKKIAKNSSGFLYLVAVYGITGVKTKIQKYTISAIQNTRKIIGEKIPLGVGFGVSTPEDVRRYLSSGASAVIVGSAFLRIIEKSKPKDIEAKISGFTRTLKKATKSKSLKD